MSYLSRMNNAHIRFVINERGQAVVSNILSNRFGKSLTVYVTIIYMLANLPHLYTDAHTIC